jgi:hypothetical protein
MILSRRLSDRHRGFKYPKGYSPHQIVVTGSRMEGREPRRQGGAAWQAVAASPVLHSGHDGARRLRFPSPNRCGGHEYPYPMVLDGEHGS